MTDQHRIARKGLVEVGAVEQAAVRHHGVFIAIGLDQLAFGNGALRPELLDRREDAGYGLAGPGRRCVDLRLVGPTDNAVT